MGAAADCELIGTGFLGQPVNTITTAALLIAGGFVLRQPHRRWVGAALAATGFGSFLFHGPMPPGAEWAHDVTLAWLILVIAGLGREWDRWTHLPGLGAIAILFAIAPDLADPIAVALTVAAILLVLGKDRSIRTLGPLGLIALTATIGRLGATGGPLCDPESVLQMHGIWHIGAAIGVAWYALSSPAPKKALRERQA